MIYDLEDVRAGYDVDADVVVVGSGPGGAVAAANFVAAGLRTVVVEAGPRVRPEDTAVEAPLFLARHYWDGGLRLTAGSSATPAMMGRCLGGGSVVNSAIMLKLPEYVRREWIAREGLGDLLSGPAFDRAFERAFTACKVAPTPMAVMSPRNTLVRDALERQGIPSGPLPRAVHGCEGRAHCITGCPGGRKRSVDRSYLEGASRDGAEIYTCSVVDRVLTRRGRAVGVRGRVVDPAGRRTVGRFSVRAPRVVMAAGVAHTPLILRASGLNPRGLVGASLSVHVTAGAFAIMDEPVDPWLGATQGWGAISEDIQGLKYESLWAAPSLIASNWGDVGRPFLAGLGEMRHATVGACVYRGHVTGRVGRTPDGRPRLVVRIPREDTWTLLRGFRRLVDGLLDVGARYVTTTVSGGVPKRIRRYADSARLLSRALRPSDVKSTFNHMFSSCPMSADPRRGPVSPSGAVYGVGGVWVVDSSIFPSASAVNPQATVMALSDLVSRRMVDLPA